MDKGNYVSHWYGNAFMVERKYIFVSTEMASKQWNVVSQNG